jgi:uncharacterized protein YndB with AHSA1/START domain
LTGAPDLIRVPKLTFASELFHAVTHATPEAVWGALTATGSPADWLFGMTVRSDWRPGSTVTMTITGDWRLTGEVLAVDPRRQLCYTLGDQPGEASVYVKWELRPALGMTFIRLYVDEPWPQDGVDTLEAVWLPVLSRLVARLDETAAQHQEPRH